MINGYKSISDRPKAEEENIIKLRESDLYTVIKTTFVIGMLCGGGVTALLMMVV